MTTFTAAQQLYLELTNRARMDPAAEAAEHKMTSLNQFLPVGATGSPITPEQRQVLAGSNVLTSVADSHARLVFNQMAAAGGQINFNAHDGAGDGSPTARIAAAGYAQNFLGNGVFHWPENFGWSNTTFTIDQEKLQEMIEGQHAGLFIDDPANTSGPPAAHRLAMLSTPMKEMGVGVVTGQAGGINQMITFENFGSSGSHSFLTGAVYNDNVVVDNFYSLGEGVQGVRATVTNGGSDTTGAGGGWSVAHVGGTFGVTFSGGGLATSVSATIAAGSLNAKVDLVNGSRIDSSASATLGAGARDLRLLGMDNVNGTGNGGANVLTGNKGANVLTGMGGNDTLDGGAGIDTAVFSGRKADYQITVLSSTSARLADARGGTPDGTDTIVNIERVVFSDGAFDFGSLTTTAPPPKAGSVAIGDVTITEGANGVSLATFTVTRSGGSAAFDVAFATADGTATTADGDYVAKSGTLRFGAGIDRQTVTIEVKGDAKVEANETFSVRLASATNGAIIADGTGVATITNDDAAPAPKAGSISIGDVTIKEGANGVSLATFTVTRSGGSAAFDVAFATADGTARVADGDYAAKTGTLRFGAGIDRQTITVEIKGDTKVEANETFSVRLASATNGAIIADGTGVATITNDDATSANRAPVVTTQDVSMGVKAAISASSLFKASDLDGNGTIKTYAFWDGGSGGGHFEVGGVAKASGAWIQVGAADLAKVKYVGGATAGGSENLFVAASDGQVWSATKSLTATTVARAGSDFNGDHASDVLWQHKNGNVAMWQLSDSKITGGAVVGSIASTWHAQGIDDFGGDGRADVLWRHDNGAVAMWQMNGFKVAANTGVGSVGKEWQVAGVDDFNGDGRADILWSTEAGKVAMWQMNGSKIAANVTVGSLPAGWQIEGTGDFNGDGKADVLLHSDKGAVAIWQMDGARIVSGKIVGSVDSTWNFAAVDDFNGDGQADILWRNDNGKVALWEMDGQKIAANLSVGSASTAWDIVDTGDYDRDGHADILWQHDNGAVAVWEMDGARIDANKSVGTINLDWHLV